MSDGLRFVLPPDLLDALTDAVADRVLARLKVEADERSPWLSLGEACEHVRLPRGRLYKLTAANAIPCRRVGSRILFRRDELDAWLDGLR